MAGFIRAKTRTINTLQALQNCLKENPLKNAGKELQIVEDSGQFCQNISTDLFLYLQDITDSEPVQLEEYALHMQENAGIAHRGQLSKEAKRLFAKYIERLPGQGEEMDIVRGRFVNGHLEVLVKKTDDILG